MGVPPAAVDGQAAPSPRRTMVWVMSPCGSVQESVTAPGFDVSADRPVTGLGGWDAVPLVSPEELVPPLPEPLVSDPLGAAACFDPVLVLPARRCAVRCSAELPPVGSGPVTRPTV